MSKALVIKGANFAVNKVETITLSNPIPCEGITLSQSTISASALGVVTTLTATLTPADTTDQVVWTSSDEDVATVANGVVTVVGVGTATITAACGTQSATCALTCEVVMTLSDFVDGYQFTSTDLSCNPPKNYASVYTYGVGRIYASDDATPSDIKAFTIGKTAYSPMPDKYPIMMPKNTAIIEVDVEIQASIKGKIYFFDSTSHQTYVDLSPNVNNGALVTQYTTDVSCVNNKYTFTKTAEVADSFALQIGNNPVSDIPNNITVTFKAS